MQKADCCSRLICRCWSAPTVASCVHYALWRVFVTGRGGGANVGTEAGMHQYTASFSNMYSFRWKTPFGTIPFGGPRAKKGTVQKVLFFSFPCKKPEPEGLFLQVSLSCWSLCIVFLLQQFEAARNDITWKPGLSQRQAVSCPAAIFSGSAVA